MGFRELFKNSKMVGFNEFEQIRNILTVPARRRELRELVENSQAQVEKLQQQLRQVEGKADDATDLLVSTNKELERVLPFEKEVKEKNLLIGKLRHEAVILNDHLTKALRYLRKGKPEDTIDKFVGHHVRGSCVLIPLDNSSPTTSCIFWLWNEAILRNFKYCRLLQVY